jgi:hypothetical protein
VTTFTLVTAAAVTVTVTALTTGLCLLEFRDPIRPTGRGVLGDRLLAVAVGAALGAVFFATELWLGITMRTAVGV